MKILFTAPIRKIGPEIVASRERIIYVLARGMIKRNHEVSILATADSTVVGARIIPIISSSFNTLEEFENPFYAQTSYLVQLAKKIEVIAKDFDIIHNHTYPEFINLLTADKISTPMLTTIHAQATAELDAVLSVFSQQFVAISQAHKKLFKKTAIQTVVYNGVDTGTFAYHETSDAYMLWIGRLAASKYPDGSYQDIKGICMAIDLSKKTSKPLRMAGTIEDMNFFDKYVRPHLSDTIEWIGETEEGAAVSREDVITLMQHAKVFLMPVNWEEPFGLVMAEAMSCGTPVIGFARGAVPEIIQDGRTGFIINPTAVDKRGSFQIKKTAREGLIAAVERIYSLDENVYKTMRKQCREHIELHFNQEKMIANYEALYKSLVKNEQNN